MKAYIEPILRRGLAQIGAPEETEIVLERPKQADHGDLATSVALGLARPLKKAPRQIAEELVAALEINEKYISGVEIAGPGFINFRFTPEFFQMRLDDIQKNQGDEFGKLRPEKPLRINVEYVSANPTGPLHPGHGRNAALGDTIANILEWSGNEVTKEYYFNNAGNQMRNLALTIHARYLELLGLDFVLPENAYMGEYVIDIARAFIEEHGENYVEPTEETLDAMRLFGEKWNFAGIEKTMEALGIKHDVYFNETTLYEEGKIEEDINRLGELGKTFENEGALYLNLEESGRDN
ncbi:MAG: arginine--tRNA ligase, partial [Candidatus Kapaibacterium sp.]